MRTRIRYILLKFIPAPLVIFARTMKLLISGDYLKLRRKAEETELAVQRAARILLQQDRSPLVGERFQHTINNYEATIFSQNGEDGILFAIFSRIGTGDGRFVEFGIGDGRQCNTANLLINFGWRGLYMEADRDEASSAQRYFDQSLGDRAYDARVLNEKVTVENINDLLSRSGMQGRIDLLSIDIDGNDYWIWHAISAISPRVVVIEYNATFGDSKQISIPYDPDFSVDRAHPSGYYHGASLAALAKLGERKGYALIGCESMGVNAFFVDNHELGESLKPLAVKDAYFPHMRRSAGLDPEEQMKLIDHLPFEEV